MADEDENVEENGWDSFYDEIRADVETAIYAYTSLAEIDMGLLGKIAQKNLSGAKRDCTMIICRGLRIICEGYETKSEKENEEAE